MSAGEEARGLNIHSSNMAMKEGASMSTHPRRLLTVGPHFRLYIMPYPAVTRCKTTNTNTARQNIPAITE